MFVWSVIWINSTEIRGGRSIGFFDKKGQLKVANIIIPKWSPDDAIIFLYTHYLSLYGSEIRATLVNPDPDNMPIISNTLP